MGTFFKEFRTFAMRGNMIDMAVGIILGAAFGKVVSSLVADIAMPPLGLLIGGVEFTQLQLVLKEAADGSAAVTLTYGKFIQTVVDFLIVAFAVFVVVRTINKLKGYMPAEEAAAAAPAAPKVPEDVQLLTEIRDLLKKQSKSK
ncbi:MAG: large-conductance mechanosensitive channel protein MscL [Proteobacteria bacterium]|nr:large-conductance mechanosensitive channel protein MscL [Pseudomonadota bacterium]